MIPRRGEVPRGAGVTVSPATIRRAARCRKRWSRRHLAGAPGQAGGLSGKGGVVREGRGGEEKSKVDVQASG